MVEEVRVLAGCDLVFWRAVDCDNDQLSTTMQSCDCACCLNMISTVWADMVFRALRRLGNGTYTVYNPRYLHKILTWCGNALSTLCQFFQRSRTRFILRKYQQARFDNISAAVCGALRRIAPPFACLHCRCEYRVSDRSTRFPGRDRRQREFTLQLLK